MLDEATIQYALFRYLTACGYVAVMPNVSWSWLLWEADLIGVLKSNRWAEYEIKISKSDFQNDFKKFKHIYLSGNPIHTARVPNYFWYVAPIKAVPLCIPDYAGLIEVEEIRTPCDYQPILAEGETIEDYDTIEIRPTIIKRAKLLHKDRLSCLNIGNLQKFWMIRKGGCTNG